MNNKEHIRFLLFLVLAAIFVITLVMIEDIKFSLFTATVLILNEIENVKENIRDS